jgi:hypothetical protein
MTVLSASRNARTLPLLRLQPEHIAAWNEILLAGVRPSRTWGCVGSGGDVKPGDVMKWRVLLEVTGTNGTRCRLAQVRCVPGDNRPDPDRGQAVLATLQRCLVRAQAACLCEERRHCRRCGSRHSIKDHRVGRLMTVFGEVACKCYRPPDDAPD